MTQWILFIFATSFAVFSVLLLGFEEKPFWTITALVVAFTTAINLHHSDP